MNYLQPILKSLTWALLAFPLFLIAQPNTNSPYSRYGIGDIQDRSFDYINHMGGLSATYHDDYFINASNPASLSYLKATAFDIGLHAKYSVLDDGEKQNLWSGNLSYLSLAFPLQNIINDALERIERDFRVGMGFTLMPYSNVGYDISYQDTLADIGAVTRNFEGNGGTYQFLYGASAKYKNLSFGMQTGYLFGNIEYQRNLIFRDLESAFSNIFTSSYSVTGFVWNGGVMYDLDLNKSKWVDDRTVRAKTITFGLYGNTKTKFKTNSSSVEEAVQFILNNSTPGPRDTLNSSDSIVGRGHLPAELGIGLMYKAGDQFGIGLDFKYTKWSQYDNDVQQESLDDTYKVSFGGYFRPNASSYNNFLARVIYRYGAFYKTDPIAINSETLKNYGVSIGFGLPFITQRKVSHANLGVILGRRGEGTVIQEDYIRCSFSFTFNDDEWFIQRKYN